MKNLLKLEELALMILGIFMFGLLGYQWWWLPVLILTPDISMLGYIANLFNVTHYTINWHNSFYTYSDGPYIWLWTQI